jgi:cation transport ATPase
MNDRNLRISWSAIAQGVAIVYGTTVLSGLVFAFIGIQPQTDQVVYPLLALLTGAVGVGLALRVAQTTRPSYLVYLGVGVWLLSSTSVLLGAQSLTGWVNSSAFIAIMVLVGRLLRGFTRDTHPAPTRSYANLVQRAARTRRNA